MLSLSDRDWKEFRLLDYFNYIKGNQNDMASLTPGNVPLVSAKKIDNGYKCFVADSGKKPAFKGHCITINNDGDGGAGIAYYQPADMLLDTHVTALLPKEDYDENILLFWVNCITVQREKFGHGYSLNNARLSVFRVMLPIDKNDLPDFGFMQEYIAERKQKIMQKYISYISNNIQFGGGMTPLHKKEWRAFRLGELFMLVPGKGKGANHLQSDISGISYLGATNRNNAVLDFVKPVPELVQPGNCIAFIRNGEGSMGYAVYKRERFIATADITAGYSEHLNLYTGVFITTVADMVRGKYNFNYKRSDTRLKKEMLQLPINETGMPDWEYMEEYGKYLFAKLKLQYLREKQIATA